MPENYHGAIESPKDSRRILVGEIDYVPDPQAPSWEAGYNIELRYGRLKREHQGSSSSCVGQGWSKYVEMKNLIRNLQNKTPLYVDISAKGIYSQIYILPNGGAYIIDGAKIVVKSGAPEEVLVPSYINGLPPNEEFMRDKSWMQNAQIIKNAEKYDAEKFVWLPTSWPLTEADWEHMRQMIWQERFSGFVSGYSGHCMYASAYGMKNGKRFINFINSYGEGTDLIYQGDVPLYDVTSLVFLQNPPDKINMKKIIGDRRDQRQYLVGDDGVLHWIFGQPGQDSPTLKALISAGIITGEIEWRDNIDGLVIGEPFALLKTKVDQPAGKEENKNE